MNRLLPCLAALVFCFAPRARGEDAPASASPSADKPTPPAPPPESLHDLRAQVARGKLGDSAALCDRLAVGYEARRDAELARKDKQGYLDSFMAGYCRYVKSQVLSLKGDFPGAEAALQEATAYRAQRPESKLKALDKIWLELDSVTHGLLLEKKGQAAAAAAKNPAAVAAAAALTDSAVQVYLQANESSKATSRLAELEFRRGHADQAKTWAYIHADDPTSEYVLAQVAFKARSYSVAQQHVGRALAQLQKSLATSAEYMPAYYCEFPDLVALRGKLQPFLPKPTPKPAPAAPPAPKPSPTATTTTTPLPPAPASPVIPP